MTACTTCHRWNVTIMESIAACIIAVDHEQHILNINEASSSVLGLLPEDRGRKLGEVLREPELLGFVTDGLARDDDLNRDIRIYRRGGREINAIGHPIIDSESGDRVGLVIMLDDVTRMRKLESMRTDFASNVSHELKTPITSVRGYAETMLEEGLDEDTKRHCIEVIYRNTERISNIIADLLELSKLEHSAEVDPERLEHVDAEAMFTRMKSLHEDLASTRDMRTHIDVDQNLVIQSGSSPDRTGSQQYCSKCLALRHGRHHDHVGGAPLAPSTNRAAGQGRRPRHFSRTSKETVRAFLPC